MVKVMPVNEYRASWLLEVSLSGKSLLKDPVASVRSWQGKDPESVYRIVLIFDFVPIFLFHCLRANCTGHGGFQYFTL